MATDAHDAPDASGGERPGRERVSIAERAARRQYLEQHGYDGPEGLLRHLREGRGDTVVRRGRFDLVFHPVARKLVVAFLAAATVYLVVSFVATQLRNVRVDTWAGPDASVTSGMRLVGCALFEPAEDPEFPNWVRMDGRIYQPSGAQMPVGPSNLGVYYIDSGYTNGNLRLYRVTLAGLGEPGTRILVRSGDAPAGGLFEAIPGCQ